MFSFKASACRALYSVSFGQLRPVCIFKNINATFPSGMKYDLRPNFGLMLLLTNPKFSAIA